MKASEDIVKKIWFSFTVPVIGYFFSMLLGFFEGHQIAVRLLDLSERQFPIVQKSEMALMVFKEQIHCYSNAIIIRDSAQIEKAGESARKVRGFLREIATLKTQADPIYRDMVKTIKELDEFGNKAESVYTRLSTDFKTASADPAVTKDFRALVSQTNRLQKRLEDYTTQFSYDLKLNLADIRKTSQQQPYWNFLVFIGVVVGSILLINLFISRSIIRPFQKYQRSSNQRVKS
jgi:hypothetical protein